MCDCCDREVPIIDNDILKFNVINTLNKYNSIVKTYDQYGNVTTIGFRIEYCPVCGKKLGEFFNCKNNQHKYYKRSE